MKYEFGIINVNILFDDNGKIVKIYGPDCVNLPTNLLHAIGKKLEEAMDAYNMELEEGNKEDYDNTLICK